MQVGRWARMEVSKITKIVLLFVIIVSLQGCFDDDSESPAVSVPETGQVTIKSVATQRVYHLIIPRDYDHGFFDKPLLFAFHGATADLARTPLDIQRRSTQQSGSSAAA